MKKAKPSGISGFLFESRVANILITLNIFNYFFIGFTAKGQELFHSWVLFPGNLLEGKFWCLITSGFIHGNLVHLLLNMLGIFIFARIVERYLGTTKTFFVYFGALIISMLTSTLIYAFWWQKSVAIIGASGALMGLIAAAILLDPFCITYEMILPLPIMVKGWIFLYADIIGFLGGEQDGVSHVAHLCGFLSIVVLVYFLSKEDKKLMQAGLIINIISLIAFVLLRNWAILNS